MCVHVYYVHSLNFSTCNFVLSERNRRRPLTSKEKQKKKIIIKHANTRADIKMMPIILYIYKYMRIVPPAKPVPRIIKAATEIKRRKRRKKSPKITKFMEIFVSQIS